MMKVQKATKVQETPVMSFIKPAFIDSPYFVDEPFSWHLKDGAPELVKKEYELFMRAVKHFQLEVDKSCDEGR